MKAKHCTYCIHHIYVFNLKIMNLILRGCIPLIDGHLQNVCPHSSLCCLKEGSAKGETYYIFSSKGTSCSDNLIRINNPIRPPTKPEWISIGQYTTSTKVSFTSLLYSFSYPSRFEKLVLKLIPMDK